MEVVWNHEMPFAGQELEGVVKSHQVVLVGQTGHQNWCLN